MIEILTSELLADAGFPTHGFTTRQGGVSSGPYSSLNLAHDVGDDPATVADNLMRLRAAIGVDTPLHRVRQIHSNRVVDASELIAAGSGDWTPPPTVEADAIIATGTPALLAVQVADCAAVLVADPQSGAVAAIHAGWRGTDRGVVRTTLRRLTARGVTPRRLVAAIGPCICAACYEVGEEVARRFPESSEPLRGKSGKHLLDLGNAIEVALVVEGLTSSNIERVGACSRCDDRLFSRRGEKGANCGRTLGFIATASGRPSIVNPRSVR